MIDGVAQVTDIAFLGASFVGEGHKRNLIKTGDETGGKRIRGIGRDVTGEVALGVEVQKIVVRFALGDEG